MGCEAGSDASSAANVLQNLDPNMTVNRLKERPQTPLVKSIGGVRQLRLVDKRMDNGNSDRLDLFNDLLPLIDLKSIRDADMFDFMCEDHAIVMNAQCGYAWSIVD